MKYPYLLMTVTVWLMLPSCYAPNNIAVKSTYHLRYEKNAENLKLHADTCFNAYKALAVPIEAAVELSEKKIGVRRGTTNATYWVDVWPKYWKIRNVTNMPFTPIVNPGLPPNTWINTAVTVPGLVQAIERDCIADNILFGPDPSHFSIRLEGVTAGNVPNPGCLFYNLHIEYTRGNRSRSYNFWMEQVWDRHQLPIELLPTLFAGYQASDSNYFDIIARRGSGHGVIFPNPLGDCGGRTVIGQPVTYYSAPLPINSDIVEFRKRIIDKMEDETDRAKSTVPGFVLLLNIADSSWQSFDQVLTQYILHPVDYGVKNPGPLREIQDKGYCRAFDFYLQALRQAKSNAAAAETWTGWNPNGFVNELIEDKVQGLQSKVHELIDQAF